MEKCDCMEIKIEGVTFNVPKYYQQIDALPDDPPGAVPFAVATPYAKCFFIGYSIGKEQMIPMNQIALIDGVRSFLAGNQGIIECNSEDNWAYTIIKTQQEPSGVQYTLTFQMIADDKIIFIQGSFEEDGTTGIRDTIVYEILRESKQIGTDENPLEGWFGDPYDKEYNTGALMNVSELRIFDKQFPGTPLAVCRELVDSLII